MRNMSNTHPNWNHLRKLICAPIQGYTIGISLIAQWRSLCLRISGKVAGHPSTGSLTANQQGKSVSERYSPVGRGTEPGWAGTLLSSWRALGPSPWKGMMSSYMSKCRWQHGHLGVAVPLNLGHRQVQQNKWPQMVITPPRTYWLHSLHT